MDEKTLARFWSKVDQRGTDECWLWTGATLNGYGQFSVDGRVCGTHRIALALSLGDFGDWLACHTCEARYARGDGTYKRCCNPRHLYPGTYADNMRDAIEFRRWIPARGEASGRRTRPECWAGRTPRGSRNGRAKLTAEQVAEIIQRRRAGETCVALAREFGVSATSISNYALGKSWLLA